MSAPTTQPPAAPAASQTQAPATGANQDLQKQAEVRKMKLKLDGKEVELPESEVISYAQQGKVASQRFEEAARMRKEAEQILAYAKENPAEFFAKTGMNARQWAEDFLIKELQHEAMSPEQKKARENEEKLRKFEADEKGRKEKERKEQIDRLTSEKRQEMDLMFTKALNESGLPRTPYTVKRMAELQLLNIKNKYELSASQLAKIVREDYANEQKSLIGAFDGNQLMEFLGEENVKKLSRAQIEKLKARKGPGALQSSSSSQPRPSSGESLTWDEYKKRNRRIK